MKIEEQHKKALEEDPSVFDYDGVYDDMKEKVAKPKIQDQTERKVIIFSYLLLLFWFTFVVDQYYCGSKLLQKKQPNLKHFAFRILIVMVSFLVFLFLPHAVKIHRGSYGEGKGERKSA